MYQFAAATLYVLLLFLFAAVIHLLKNIPAVLSWRDVDKTCTISQGDSGGSNGAGSDEYSSPVRAVADNRRSGGPVQSS